MFPRRTPDPLKKIFDRNTLKFSYCCTPNIKNIIDGHNKSKMKPQTEENNKCHCRDKRKCPLNGDFRQSGLAYQAEVKEENGAI